MIACIVAASRFLGCDDADGGPSCWWLLPDVSCAKRGQGRFEPMFGPMRHHETPQRSFRQTLRGLEPAMGQGGRLTDVEPYRLRNWLTAAAKGIARRPSLAETSRSPA
jgi:hypothetical protein